MAFGALIPGSIRARMDILVLEDDNELAKSFTRCLIDRGFNATFQTSIAEALTYLKMNKPSVIISDFNLGSGETAFDFILKIPLVNIGPEIPVFINTGSKLEVDSLLPQQNDYVGSVVLEVWDKKDFVKLLDRIEQYFSDFNIEHPASGLFIL